MKTLFLLAAFTVSVFSTAISQNVTLTIKISGISSVTGNIGIGIYNDADQFPDVGGEYKKITLKVTATTMQYDISLPAGSYAIALFHDENSDGECNTNWLGIPTEGYGFSNNIEPVVSAPSFNETKVSVAKHTTITINMIY